MFPCVPGGRVNSSFRMRITYVPAGTYPVVLDGVDSAALIWNVVPIEANVGNCSRLDEIVSRPSSDAVLPDWNVMASGKPAVVVPVVGPVYPAGADSIVRVKAALAAPGVRVAHTATAIPHKSLRMMLLMLAD
jgi:hypothetical protein